MTMKSFLILLFAIASITGTNAISTQETFQLTIGLEKCYGELGCFSIIGDFMDLKRRPIQVFPQSRQDVGTTFDLFTRQHSVNGRPLEANNDRLLQQSGFRENKSAIFIVHGFMQSSAVTWVYNMRRDLLIKEDVNVVVVDWKNGALLPYVQATANTRLVGAEISLLLNYLKRQKSAFSLARVHLIGHSLGAHACGYAGKYFTSEQVGRISGLDPAGPYFEGTKAVMRIDRNDASFVSIIHTNGDKLLKAGFGMMQAVGDVDIYPNGGKQQAGCSGKSSIINIIKEGLVEAVACSHMRVVHLFTATILNECPFTAFRCEDYETFQSGSCFNCSAEGACVMTGLNTAKPTSLDTSAPNLYFMETGPVKPFCGYHYGIKIHFSSSSKVYSGRFIVKLNTLYDDDSLAMKIPRDDKYFTVKPGEAVGGVVLSMRRLNSINSLTFEWTREKSIWKPSSWRGGGVIRVTRIVVFDVFQKRSQDYCSLAELKTKEVHTFVKC